MTTYIILSRFSPEAFEDPKNFRDLAAAVSVKIKKQCPDIAWKGSFATLGVTSCPSWPFKASGLLTV